MKALADSNIFSMQEEFDLAGNYNFNLFIVVREVPQLCFFIFLRPTTKTIKISFYEC